MGSQIVCPENNENFYGKIYVGITGLRLTEKVQHELP